MDWQEVLHRIESGESHSTEFKSELGKKLEPVGQAICAFANGAGGLIVFGVDDAGGIVGLNSDPHGVHERLTNFLQSGLSSPVFARCGRQQVENRWVHWMDVPRIRGFEPLQFDRRFYVRRERSNVEPSPVELQELFNAFGFVLTEEQAIPAASVQDVDTDAFRLFQRKQGIDIEAKPQPSIEDDLRNADVVREFDGAFRPTLYGLLIFGKKPQSHRQTGGFFIQCTAYLGTDRSTDVIGGENGEGRLYQQVLSAISWVKTLGWTEDYSKLIREDRPLIPEMALREALVNAVVHRDYSITGSSVILDVFKDRVVVTSPGALPNHMTVEKVQAGGIPRARNQVMAHAMLEVGLVEKRGRGWMTMRSAMMEFNGTEPELVNDVANKFVRVTLFR